MPSRRDIANSSLCLSPAADLSDLCLQYDSVLSSILNKHAPLRRKSFSRSTKSSLVQMMKLNITKPNDKLSKHAGENLN